MLSCLAHNVSFYNLVKWMQCKWIKQVCLGTVSHICCLSTFDFEKLAPKSKSALYTFSKSSYSSTTCEVHMPFPKAVIVFTD